jgi:O-antigen/teichoic acid export membrane protein
LNTETQSAPPGVTHHVDTGAVNKPRSALFKQAAWTIGSFGGSFLLKFGSNVVLSRLLAPEIFGIMVVINSIKTGIELLTDVGVEQNIVSSAKGSQPDFFNTAWTIQILRGFALSCVFLLLSPLLSNFYKIDLKIFMVVSATPFVNSLSSTSIFLLVKDLRVKERNLFELATELVTFLVYITLALITPTVWALVLGIVVSLTIRAIASYRLPHPKHRFLLDRTYTQQIFHFGKWIMASSLVIFAATNLDRIYLGKVIPFAILGIYGIARTIAEIPVLLSSRISYQLIFPALAALASDSKPEAVVDLRNVRRKIMLAGAFLLATLAAWSDVAINLIYDKRYHEAGGMLFFLLIGAWFSIMSNLNEAVILGRGRPAYNSLTNSLRLIVLAVLLPSGYLTMGLVGAILALIVTEVVRYGLVLIAQSKAGLTFRAQDFVATALVTATMILWLVLRQLLSLDLPWHSLPHA